MCLWAFFFGLAIPPIVYFMSIYVTSAVTGKRRFITWID